MSIQPLPPRTIARPGTSGGRRRRSVELASSCYRRRSATEMQATTRLAGVILGTLLLTANGGAARQGTPVDRPNILVLISIAVAAPRRYATARSRSGVRRA